MYSGITLGLNHRYINLRNPLDGVVASSPPDRKVILSGRCKNQNKLSPYALNKLIKTLSTHTGLCYDTDCILRPYSEAKLLENEENTEVIFGEFFLIMRTESVISGHMGCCLVTAGKIWL